MFFHEMSPELSGSPEFGNFHVEIHRDAPEKAEPGCKLINI